MGMQTLDDAEDELLEAMRRSDVEVLDRVISEELQFTGPDGSRITKHDDLEAHRRGATNFDAIDECDRKTHMTPEGGTTDTTAAVVLVDGTSRIHMKILWHRDWQVHEGLWKVMSGSATLLPE